MENVTSGSRDELRHLAGLGFTLLSGPGTTRDLIVTCMISMYA